MPTTTTSKRPRVAVLKRLPNSTAKKWQVVLYDRDGVKIKTVRFGAAGYEDYTTHKDSERKHRYVRRHRERENWGKSGVGTAGFWSRWLLWNKPSLVASSRDVSRRFCLRVENV
jgi:hypothetical protein